MCLIHFPHMLTVHGMAYHSNYCQENSIKRIISPVLIVFSLKTERIKVVILCLLWSDLSLKSSQLPLVFLSGLANQISCSHERFSFIVVLGCIFVYNYLLSQKDYIFLPSWLQVWSCDLFCSICEKISDTHIFTSRNFKHLHSYSHLTSLCLNACNDLCRSCSVNLGSRGRHEKEPCLTCDSYEVLTIIKLIL